MEFWDAYDKNGNRLAGQTLVRGETIPAGIYHLVCEVLVQHRDGSYLLMQRDGKKHFGGMWEASAGGSALQGETPLEAARRELREETGIAAAELTELGRVVHHQRQTVYLDFLAVTDWDKEKITLQEGETQAFRWVTAAGLKAMPSTKLVTRRMQIFVEEIG